MLQTLNKNLQHQICAENSINSYNSCVLKLIRNSLDAKASVFHLDLDPSNFYIKIKDNGIGISLKNLAKVGERYYTTNEILKNVNRGETLANISSLASILQIKTREKSNPLTYIKIYCQGRALDITTSSKPLSSSGTIITIKNLFYNLPVRKKWMTISRERYFLNISDLIFLVKTGLIPHSEPLTIIISIFDNKSTKLSSHVAVFSRKELGLTPKKVRGGESLLHSRYVISNFKNDTNFAKQQRFNRPSVSTDVESSCQLGLRSKGVLHCNILISNFYSLFPQYSSIRLNHSIREVNYRTLLNDNNEYQVTLDDIDKFVPGKTILTCLNDRFASNNKKRAELCDKKRSSPLRRTKTDINISVNLIIGWDEASFFKDLKINDLHLKGLSYKQHQFIILNGKARSLSHENRYSNVDALETNQIRSHINKYFINGLLDSLGDPNGYKNLYANFVNNGGHYFYPVFILDINYSSGHLSSRTSYSDSQFENTLLNHSSFAVFLQSMINEILSLYHHTRPNKTVNKLPSFLPFDFKNNDDNKSNQQEYKMTEKESEIPRSCYALNVNTLGSGLTLPKPDKNIILELSHLRVKEPLRCKRKKFETDTIQNKVAISDKLLREPVLINCRSSHFWAKYRYNEKWSNKPFICSDKGYNSLSEIIREKDLFRLSMSDSCSTKTSVYNTILAGKCADHQRRYNYRRRDTNAHKCCNSVKIKYKSMLSLPYLSKYRTPRKVIESNRYEYVNNSTCGENFDEYVPLEENVTAKPICIDNNITPLFLNTSTHPAHSHNTFLHSGSQEVCPRIDDVPCHSSNTPTASEFMFNRSPKNSHFHPNRYPQRKNEDKKTPKLSPKVYERKAPPFITTNFQKYINLEAGLDGHDSSRKDAHQNPIKINLPISSPILAIEKAYNNDELSFCDITSKQRNTQDSIRVRLNYSKKLAKVMNDSINVIEKHRVDNNNILNEVVSTSKDSDSNYSMIETDKTTILEEAISFSSFEKSDNLFKPTNTLLSKAERVISNNWTQKHFKTFKTLFKTSTPYQSSSKLHNSNKFIANLVPVIHNNLYKIDMPTNTDKTIFDKAKVIGQLDQKYICFYVNNSLDTTIGEISNEFDIYLLDQHAAHERILLESLSKKYFPRNKDIDASLIVPLSVPVLLSLSQEDTELIIGYKEQFWRLGIHFECDEYIDNTGDFAIFKDGHRIRIKNLPEALFLNFQFLLGDVYKSQKYSTSHKKNKKNGDKKLALKMDDDYNANIVLPNSFMALIKNLIIEIIQEIKSSNGIIRRIPKTLFEILCSKACHNAIKFNEPLTNLQCAELIMQLKFCNLPFQCAHGRPSLMPLINFRQLSSFFRREIPSFNIKRISSIMTTTSQIK
ncbi:unnamed protein product [Gordionus sp. m RMFG-2023]|uniref:uncharacterized protein LOC135930862 isoform X2 n=1 Tax=Gordionus sp. m RMFG-2023 TaxID=3053472 RepID=UPI0030E291E0